MKVLFITNLPSPYRVDFFELLGRACDLTVLFETDCSWERDQRWRSDKDARHFRSIFLKSVYRKRDSAFCPGVLKYLTQRKYDIIVVCGISTSTTILAIMYMKLCQIPYYIECDGGIPQRNGGIGIKEYMKKWIVPGAEGYFSTGKLNDEYLQQYGVDAQSIIRYPFSSIHKRDIPGASINDNGKNKLRRKLRMPEKRVVLSVGRFSYLRGYGKGYDTLLNAATKLPKDIGVYIIGEEATEEFVDMKHRLGLSNVHFIGFKTKNELAEYYRCADIFVLMTISDVWGLVINEAMTYGLPIITTDMCGAGVALIESGKNGYILEVGDSDTLCEKIMQLAEDNELRETMGTNNYRRIHEYTLETMTDRHVRIFDEIIRKDGK